MYPYINCPRNSAQNTNHVFLPGLLSNIKHKLLIESDQELSRRRFHGVTLLLGKNKLLPANFFCCMFSLMVACKSKLRTIRTKFPTNHKEAQFCHDKTVAKLCKRYLHLQITQTQVLVRTSYRYIHLNNTHKELSLQTVL